MTGSLYSKVRKEIVTINNNEIPDMMNKVFLHFLISSLQIFASKSPAGNPAINNKR